MLISQTHSSLLVVDIQERLAPAIWERDRLIVNAGILMRAAEDLSVPVLLSEQYPQGLGGSVEQIAALAPPDSVISKIQFSCMGNTEFASRFESLQRSQAVVVGMESHVCVLQTVDGLLEAGKDVFVVEDAVSSRTQRNHIAALERMRAAGAVIVTTEMVVFEWLGQAGTPQFRRLSALIK